MSVFVLTTWTRPSPFHQGMLDAKLVVGPISVRPTRAAVFTNGPSDTTFNLANLHPEGAPRA